MTQLQIILISVFGGFAFLSLLFILLFIIEITVEHKTDEIVPNIFTKNDLKFEKQETVADMLANLDNQTKIQSDETESYKKTVEKVSLEEIENNRKEEVEHIAQKPEETIKTIQNITQNNIVVNNNVEDEKLNEFDDQDDIVIDDDQEDFAVEEQKPKIQETKQKEDPIVITEIIDNSIDYSDRLKQVIEKKSRIDKDLEKIENNILKYDRTIRRKDRNQKMLDRRAGELTNLNLLMYSVTDIKNIDEDKKTKQEELTTHIAELKASIQDAEEYIESNKEKYLHDVEMSKFLKSERERLNAEIIEIKKVMAETNK